MTRLGAMALLALLLSACSAPVIKGTLFKDATLPGAPVASLALSKDDAIVVLNAESTGKDESWPTACVRDALASADTELHVMTATEFRDAMFPWFETHNVAQAIAELETMPGIKRGVEQIGVRYIITVGGSTMASSMEDDGWGAAGQGGLFYVGKHGLMLCGAGPGGAGCLGFLAWQRTSDLSAVVWDLRRGSQIAAIAAKVTGTNLMPAFGLPVPLIAPTETASCRELGSHLAKFLTTGEVPESKEVDVVKDEPRAQ
jgi:hypothetical protein